jgi:protein-disulfide isomerase
MSYQAKLRVPVTREDHAQGPENAAITLLEYGDFQCPYCAQAYHVVKHLQDVIKDELRIVFRNFPLTEIHPGAMDAARAAEAAAQQGRFWEMHAMLFENRNNLDPDSLYAFAGALRLDTRRFARELEGAKVERKIAEDIQGGVRSGVNGTPTFFINGVRYDGDWSYEPFLEALTSLAS